jgi:penicillin-binding protein 1C
VPSFEAVRAAHRPSDVPVLARDGSVLQTVRTQMHVRQGPWLALEDISPALHHAIVLGEDRRFWQHGGVDWAALAGAAWANAWNTRTRGASTLTMQLAALSDAELLRPAGGRSVGQKLTQLRRAQQFEAQWSKAQILEAYLNRVPLRGELVGISAASQQLFRKHASGLDAVEAALLAALVRAPNAIAAVVERRACEVLKLQQRGCEAVAFTWAQALARRPTALLAAAGSAQDTALAPHLSERLAVRITPRAMAARAPGQAATGPGPGEPIRTTLDADLQRAAIAALRRQLQELRGRNVEDGAVLVLDNASGEVLAWVGSSGTGLSAAAEVDAVLARRQPGSTLKPFVYAAALQRGLITAASRLDDAPLQLAGLDAGGAVYQPQNYDRSFQGPVGVRTALASSLNVPAVRLGAMLGPEQVFSTLQRAGLRPSESAGYHGHALVLGSADATLLDLANAYRMLANGGVLTAPRWQPDAGHTAARGPVGGSSAARGPLGGRSAARGSAAERAAGTRVFSPAVSFIVADMLADPAARAITFGLDSPLVTRGWAAVKTGTSKDLRDNWCIGFTRRYTVAVWVGNASGAPMHGVSGVSGAAPVWRELVAWLHAKSPSTPPAPPPGLVAQGGEWFVAGTQPAPGQAVASAVQPFGIQVPREGSVYVLDPDIPPAAQRLVFEGAPGRWLLNGRELGRGAQLRWLPRPGRHVLELQGAGVGALHRIRFEVRAAPPPAAARSRAC